MSLGGVFTGPNQFGNADDRDDGSALDNDDVNTAHRRDHQFQGLRQHHMPHGLQRRHTGRARRLALAARDGLDRRAHDLRHVGRGVQAKRDHRRRKGFKLQPRNPRRRQHEVNYIEMDQERRSPQRMNVYPKRHGYRPAAHRAQYPDDKAQDTSEEDCDERNLDGHPQSFQKEGHGEPDYLNHDQARAPPSRRWA